MNVHIASVDPEIKLSNKSLMEMYPIVTTKPPAPPPTEQLGPESKGKPFSDQSNTNEINSFSLFPPEFHDLLEIPLHTYANGSTFNTHSRYHNFPRGPHITKGYANMKIQGNSNVRTATNQDTPQVTYRPRPVYDYESDERMSSLTSSTTKHILRTTTVPSTTRRILRTTTQSLGTTTTSTTTESPRKSIFESYLSRSTQEYPSRKHIVTYDQSSISPYSQFSRPTETELVEKNSKEINEYENTRVTMPDSIPPLRYTRRPATQYTTLHPTTLRPYATRYPVTQAVTKSTPNSSTKPLDESFSKFLATIRPASGSELHREVSSHPSDVGANSSSFTNQRNSTPSSQSTVSDELPLNYSFRPSKLDIYLKPQFPSTTTSKTPAYFDFEYPEVLPPVVNTYKESAEQFSPDSDLKDNPVSYDIQPPSFSSQPPLPPPLKPSRQPLLRPPPLRAAHPSYLNLPPPPPPPPNSHNFHFLSHISAPSRSPLSRPTPSASPDVNDDTNEIYRSPFGRPTVSRQTLVPSSFGPPPRQSSSPHSRPLQPFFSRPEIPNRNQVTRPRPENNYAHSHQQPIYQLVRPVVTPLPNAQDVIEHPESGFTLPAEAGNLPKRLNQNNELPTSTSKYNTPNILLQFRPNAPPQHETFGFPDIPERNFNTQIQTLRPNNRPVLSKRPSFLENFGFFRSSINRRRGDTGPAVGINNAGNKVPSKQRLANTQALHYQLTHGSLPKHAQKVMVVGPFDKPPPGAPVIPFPDRDSSSHLLSLPPPPQPPLPSRRVTPPSINYSENRHNKGFEGIQEVIVSKRGYFNDKDERNIHRPLKAVTSSLDSGEKSERKVESDVVYGQPQNIRSRIPNGSTPRPAQPLASRPKLVVPDNLLPNVNMEEEVSEEHKEAIIAGKFKFPALTSIKRSSAGDDSVSSQNYIPMPVPILPHQEPASSRIPENSWTIVGFQPSKTKASHIKNSINNHSLPQNESDSLPSLLVAPTTKPKTNDQVHQTKYVARRPDVPKSGGLSDHLLPPPLVDSPVMNREQQEGSSTKDTEQTQLVILPTVSPISPNTNPPVSYPQPVYLHFSTTSIPATTSTSKPSFINRNMKSQTTKYPLYTSTETTQTTHLVTPMRITEFNPYYDHKNNIAESVSGVFKAPDIKDYGGWKVVGVPPTPSEGPGDALSPILTYVKENTPEIILMSPTSSTEENDKDVDVITGVISGRMGEVMDGELVQYSSRFSVETPGVVRSYMVQSPSLV
ncbi:hypothetical protein SK128_020392 [Halocaridina rubra]|uniref:Uncharacterized protein n=1 Tax=Halocaridina rubra TaxID=373956 RepID=A0AAN8X8Q1_HALRR